MCIRVTIQYSFGKCWYLLHQVTYSCFSFTYLDVAQLNFCIMSCKRTYPHFILLEYFWNGLGENMDMCFLRNDHAMGGHLETQIDSSHTWVLSRAFRLPLVFHFCKRLIICLSKQIPSSICELPVMILGGIILDAVSHLKKFNLRPENC